MRALKVHVKKFQCFLIENENHMRKFITFITAICFRCVHRHHFTFLEYLKPVFVVNIYLMSIWWVFIVCRVEIKIWQTPTRWRRVETLRLCCQWKLEKQLRKLWLNCAFDFIIYFSIYFVIHANWLLIDLSCDCLTFIRSQSMGLSPLSLPLSPSLPQSSSSVSGRAASLVVVVAMAA